MKFVSILSLLLLLGCQDTAIKEDRPVEKVSSVEDDSLLDRENFVIDTKPLGFRITGEKISRKGQFNSGENIKILETSTSKILDQFLFFDWGPVSFKIENDSLKVFPKNNFEIEYTFDEKKKLKRTTKCNFQLRPEASRLHNLLSKIKSTNPDWEMIFSGISQLAYDGDKNAYNFFLNPNAEDKIYLKQSEGEVSKDSIVNVLKFMKANGCNW
jgi:hypothetical protein